MEQQAISSDLIRGHIDTIILYALLENDKYAQQIIETVEEKTEKKYSINQATLYSSLKRLEGSKLVKSYWHDATDGRRKFFTITEKGKVEVDKNLSSWAFSRAIIDRLTDYEPTQNFFKNSIQANNVDIQSYDKDFDTIQNNFIEEPQQTVDCNLSVEDLHTQTTTIPLSLIEQNEQPNSTPNSLHNRENNFYNDEKIFQSNFTNNEESTIEKNTYFEKNGDIENFAQQKNNGNKNFYNERIENNNVNNEKEVNFRNILNGLIKTSCLKTVEQPKKIIDKIDESQQEKPKFNETITVSMYNSQRYNNNGKIDFGDLTLNAEKEGYKIKISSKDSAKPFGSLYRNKLNLFTSLIILVLLVVEITIFSVTYYKDNFNGGKAFSPVFIFAILFLYFLIQYIKNPIKTESKKLSGDRILTATIIAFNLILMIFTINFLIGTDFGNKNQIISYIIAPLIICLDVILYFIFENLLSKINIFHVKRDDV